MKDLLTEWNPWWSEEFSFKGITREIVKEILPWIERKEIISILGVRRAGKTTLLYEVVDYLIHEKGVNPKNIVFIKADDDRVEKEGLIDKAVDEYQKWMNPSARIFMFIDEIQEIKEWQ